MKDWGTYRKLYEALPPSFERLPYTARCLAAEIIRRCDNRGRLVPGTVLSETLLNDLMFHVRAHTADEMFLRHALGGLLADGYLVFRDGHLVIRNFVAAQRKDSAARMQVKRGRDSADEMDDELPSEPGESRDASDGGDAHDTPGVTPSRDLRAPHLISSRSISDPDPEKLDTKPKSKGLNARAAAVPVEMAADWQPDPEQVSALAERWSVSVARILAQVAEFRWYWFKGRGAGKRKSARGWAQTFANRIEGLAKSEALYAGAEPSGGSVISIKPGADDAERRARAAEVEARAKGAAK